MDWEVVWTEPALADFEEAVRGAAQHSESAADSLRTSILESVAVLQHFPEIGPIYERVRSGRVREIVCRMYRIFYRIEEEENRVEILVVWHSSRREPRLPDR